MHVNGETDMRAVYIVVIMVIILKLEYLIDIIIIVLNYWMDVQNILHHVKHMKEELVDVDILKLMEDILIVDMLH